MVRIKYNNEGYEITHEIRGVVWDLASADYDSSIGEHVQNIIEVLAACNVEYKLEKL